MRLEPCAIAISGLPGAGKSTTAHRLAQRLGRAAHIEADRLQEMVVAGGVWPDGSRYLSEDAAAQLDLRLRNACVLARSFVAHSFIAVIDDIVIGGRLDRLLDDLQGVPLCFVMLAPDFEHVRQRWIEIGSPFADTWGWIDEEMHRRTTRLGLWLDTTELEPDEVVDEILARLDEAWVRA